MALIDHVEIESVWVESSVRGVNETGTALVSAALSNTGEEISDNYTLTISGRTGGTGTVTVTTESANNPFNGRVITGVLFDDTTPRTDVIPGVSLVFDNAAVNSDVAVVSVGVYLGSFDASGIGAGVPSNEYRHQVVNDGADEVIDAKARLLTQAIQVATVGSVFEYVSSFAPGATEKTAGGGSDRIMPYKIEISDVGGGEATMEIDGSPVGTDWILNLSTGTPTNGVDLTLEEGYTFIDGPLEGMSFSLSGTVANGDEANVLIFPSRYVQIAPDSGGSPGTYGTADVTLTESGESAGTITASGEAYYWSRTLIPSGANNESNPYPMNIALEAMVADAAGWEA